MNRTDEKSEARKMREAAWSYRSGVVRCEVLRRQDFLARWVPIATELDLLSKLCGEWGRIS